MSAWEEAPTLAAGAGRAALYQALARSYAALIAGDAALRSERVVPVLAAPGGPLLGVFDLDSPLPGRFDATDRDGIGELLELWIRGSDLPSRP